MQTLNEVNLIGRLGKDPELKTTTLGDPYVSFSVATKETWKDKITQEKREIVEWHNVVGFKHLVDIVMALLKKGSAVYIKGKIKSLKNQDGSTRNTIIAQSIIDITTRNLTNSDKDKKIEKIYRTQDYSGEEDLKGIVSSVLDDVPLP